ncbi:MAG: glycosyl hydrolase family 32 [Burkholderiales bacterium RIFCSPHIGHO2_12_FULL_69_20]|nr:MAG: glycosyl hydrolase family 32 [Burkholderiales bacterium RIFCSPHIGHO2_12_FULL_69_20]
MTHAAVAAHTPQFRPAFHFTPAGNWMNDPNGLIFHRGVYHLFFQYHPDSSVWGPMHWGHATSTDLLRWQQQPIALRPDALGMIFSGSAVVDHENRAGFGPTGSSPLVAMFTHHDRAAEKAGRIDRQHQSLAYSLDEGRSWTKHAGNPVIANPGRQDFRDPKLRWLPERQRWIASLACGDRIAFYSSPDLRAWTLESEFGAGVGAHGGVWECPDLLPLTGPDGRTRWVLLVSLTPGGPNGGSATQYFIGQFDGHRFTPDDTQVRWLDVGPDNYAGVTWDGVHDRALFIGWMSNWRYAKDLPTAPWRSAMTMPRELALRQADDGMWVASLPARELLALQQPATLTCRQQRIDRPLDLSAGLSGSQGRFVLRLATAALRGFTLALANDAGDALRIGYDDTAHQWWVDRRDSGEVGFHPDFAGRHAAPRLGVGNAADLQLWFDATSVELFADGGLSTMTSLFFPRQPWQRATLASPDQLMLDELTIQPLRDPR